MKKIIIILLLIFTIVFAGCSQTIQEVKKDENVGKIVSISGTVEKTMKLGDLSGYTIKDKNGDIISVASESLPAEGDKIIVKGELVKSKIIGFYIDSTK